MLAILPPLSQASGVALEKAAIEFDRCLLEATKLNRGKQDTRAFLLAFEKFRSKHSFTLSELQIAIDEQKQKKP